ncbi:hypothetical protein [Paenibacillus sp.]|jgi:hypothetical protein|uniref:hypothetical protein n=1 Tax=Paenibacillus sp. TaxID=58172 RepID=UPI00281FE548|nr:hypothetical protein [Paenibacillus sp.]MDR0268772.1 hypothetical protein [Paenibacillus sp.]
MEKQKNQNYKTPNEKFNAEFAEESTNAPQNSSSPKSSNSKTPNEKFNAKFEEKN